MTFKIVPPAPRVEKPRELLFEFLVGHDRWRCELVDHGQAYGVETQFLKNEDFSHSRRFDPSLDRLRPSRELAVVWAEAERRALERA